VGGRGRKGGGAKERERVRGRRERRGGHLPLDKGPQRKYMFVQNTKGSKLSSHQHRVPEHMECSSCSDVLVTPMVLWDAHTTLIVQPIFSHVPNEFVHDAHITLIAHGAPDIQSRAK
jgi:hypothetical protein